MDEGHVTELILDDGAFTALSEHQSPEQLYQELISRVRKYHPSDDISLIEKAYNLASMAHKNQLRKSGEPYIIHPLSVAIILAELQLDKETIVSGILHDVVEDTVITDEELRDQFGNYVALIVDGVTKLEKIRYNGDKLEYQAENLRKMFLAMAKDIRVIMVKLADRLHNMRTLQYQPPERQVEIARETMDIYAPLAQRLGISKMKVELDDLSLKYLEPEVYYDLADKISIRKSEREKYVSEIVEDVKKHITNAGIEATFDGRVKHFMSIYRKMLNQDKTLDQIYDLFAVRIIVNTIPDCYAALGVIHEMYKPIPGRFKDYIAMPKANNYQSLHTSLIGPNGTPFEIQIRTYDMHRTAEFGIAAHWKYKETSDGKHPDENEEEKLSWLRQILEWQKNLSDNEEFMSLLKSDLNLFSDFVYAFTPSGDVKNLPSGSTPVDFAYAIHSAVGNRMVGARVNGKLVNIDYVIQNGDRVEIITSQNSHGPSRDWLKIVRSTQARTKINQWFKNELKEDNIVRGKAQFNDYCKAHAIKLEDIMKPEYQQAVLDKYRFRDFDAVYAAIGHGGLKEGQIVNRMVERFEMDHRRNITDEEALANMDESSKKNAFHKNEGGIIVKGITDVSVHFSKCCNPLPGDEIVGFVTRGRGISIHRTDCINIMNMLETDRVRLIEAEWEKGSENAQKEYLADINIFANNRNGLLVDVSRVFTEENIGIIGVNCRVNKQNVATIYVSFNIHSTMELDSIIQKLRSIQGVLDIERNTQ